MENESFQHIPVLYDEVMEELAVPEGARILDGTLGGAGHASGMLQSAGPTGILYGFDQDAEALEAAGKKLEAIPGTKKLFHSNYVNAVEILRGEGIDAVDVILLDLGVSSHQLDVAERGFSYMADAPLDMRMDREASLSAYEIVNTWPEDRLFRILKDYGEEKFAKNIAKHIVRAREEKPLESTFELNEVIRAAIPAKMRLDGGHPSKRSFQAIRIACNRELEVLEEAIDGMISFLAPGGRIGIISFHSLEDRIVKEHFRKAENPCICPPEFPVCACGRKSLGRVVTRKPKTATEAELSANSRSKSAKLRVFERVKV